MCLLAGTANAALLIEVPIAASSRSRQAPPYNYVFGSGALDELPSTWFIGLDVPMEQGGTHYITPESALGFFTALSNGINEPLFYTILGSGNNYSESAFFGTATDLAGLGATYFRVRFDIVQVAEDPSLPGYYNRSMSGTFGVYDGPLPFDAPEGGPGVAAMAALVAGGMMVRRRLSASKHAQP